MASSLTRFQPRRSSAASTTVTLALLALIVVGAVVIREAVVSAGWLNGSTWFLHHLWGTQRIEPSDTTLGYAGGVILIGLVLLMLAARSPRRIAVRADQAGTVWLSCKGVAKLATSVAADVDGVADVTATARPRTIKMWVQAADNTNPGAVKDAVKQRVQQAVQVLPQRPQVVVRVTKGATVPQGTGVLPHGAVPPTRQPEALQSSSEGE